MLFEVEEGPLRHIGQLVYIMKDSAFDFQPQQIADCSIEVDYISIDFIIYYNDVKRASQIWGYHYPPESWVKKELQKPEFFAGSLLLIDDVIDDGDTLVLHGSREWETYYDIHTGWVCIGDCDHSKEDMAVEFVSDAVAIINNQQLKALWLKPVIQ